MSSRAGSLHDGFGVLEVSPGTGSDIRAYPLDREPTPWGPVRLAVDASGHRHVLIPVPDDLRLRSDRRSAGIHVGPQVLEEGTTRHTFLDLVCLRPHLYDVFLRIALDIVDRINERKEPPDTCAIQVLERWRSLLSRAQRPGPSVEVLTGIFGELVHLKPLVERDRAAVARWSGPMGGVWDFTGPGHALEVKTSRVRTGWRAKIHGVHQLDPGPEHRLLLSLLRVELVAEGQGGRSVPALVDELLDLGVDAVGLYDRLDRMGLVSGHFKAAADITFRVLDMRTWAVEPGFPRLVNQSFVGSSVPVGVAAVEYELDLTACSIGPLEGAAMGAFRDGLAGVSG